MEVFVRVIELGGFSSAARALDITPSAVSKLVARLEKRLNTRLVHRSTRAMQLTAEGRTFYERSKQILADLDEAEREAAAGTCPVGNLSINCNVPFGLKCLLPMIPDFAARYPEVTLDVVLTDSVVDLMQSRADLAIRVGPLEDSTLVARKLASTAMVVVGSPEYLARHGTPLHPRELARHQVIGWTFRRLIQGWPFKNGERVEHLSPPEIARAGDGESARLLALHGLGLARLARFQVDQEVADGRLVPVLESFNPGNEEEIHAIFQGGRSPLPARVRAFVDFLVERMQATWNVAPPEH